MTSRGMLVQAMGQRVQVPWTADGAGVLGSGSRKARAVVLSEPAGGSVVGEARAQGLTGHHRILAFTLGQAGATRGSVPLQDGSDCCLEDGLRRTRVQAGDHEGASAVIKR